MSNRLEYIIPRLLHGEGNISRVRNVVLALVHNVVDDGCLSGTQLTLMSVHFILGEEKWEPA
jgi:hypothetical protein